MLSAAVCSCGNNKSGSAPVAREIIVPPFDSALDALEGIIGDAEIVVANRDTLEIDFIDGFEHRIDSTLAEYDGLNDQEGRKELSEAQMKRLNALQYRYENVLATAYGFEAAPERGDTAKGEESEEQ